MASLALSKLNKIHPSYTEIKWENKRIIHNFIGIYVLNYFLLAVSPFSGLNAKLNQLVAGSVLIPGSSFLTLSKQEIVLL